MPHPDGGRGSTFKTQYTLKRAYKAVGNSFDFLSTKDKPTEARVNVTDRWRTSNFLLHGRWQSRRQRMPKLLGIPA
jgi:hypothetical protein